MTRKDYELIASAIRRAKAAQGGSVGQQIGSTDCAYTLAASLAAENPRFDRVRFLKACGVEHYRD